MKYLKLFEEHSFDPETELKSLGLFDVYKWRANAEIEPRQLYNTPDEIKSYFIDWAKTVDTSAIYDINIDSIEMDEWSKSDLKDPYFEAHIEFEFSSNISDESEMYNTLEGMLPGRLLNLLSEVELIG